MLCLRRFLITKYTYTTKPLKEIIYSEVIRNVPITVFFSVKCEDPNIFLTRHQHMLHCGLPHT